MLRVALALGAVLLVAGCGGGSHAATGGSTSTKPCPGTAQAVATLHRDVVAIRTASRLPTKSTLDGNHAINVATDRFLHDIELSPLDNVQKNRQFDLAIGALEGSCEQCFQAFEAERPIPAIALGDQKCPTPEAKP